MTLIHQCDRCGYQGRVVELSDGYLCENCFDDYRQEQQRDEQCPECGSIGVTDSGVCYVCENYPKPTPDEKDVPHEQ